jgi:rRNA maturation endonuclease Nob1
MAADDEECPTIRKYVCSCLCEWYMPDGIEPSFCPHCGGEAVRVEKMAGDGSIGVYTENPEPEDN